MNIPPPLPPTNKLNAYLNRLRAAIVELQPIRDPKTLIKQTARGTSRENLGGTAAGGGSAPTQPVWQ